MIYNALMAGMLGKAFLYAEPTIGVQTSLPPTLQAAGRALGSLLHTAIFVWGLVWLNESGKLTPDQPYIAPPRVSPSPGASGGASSPRAAKAGSAKNA